MKKSQAKRVFRELTTQEKLRLERHRSEITRELPDLVARDRLRREARQEATLSGELRRAVHESDLPLAEIAVQAGIIPSVLDDFLVGERTLRSDVLDRLAAVLGYALNRVK